MTALDSICIRLRQKGEVIMCGDANARTGKLPDYILSCNAPAIHDIYNDIGLEHDIEEPRNNSDLTISEPHCQHFLDMVINNQLKILNGRTLGDTTGKMTCHKYNGSSVVDYFVITSWARDHVNSLQVKEFTSYSDHCPLVLKLTTFEPFVANFQLPDFSDFPCGYKWDSNTSHSLFKKALTSPEIVNNLECIVTNEFSSTLEGNHELNDAVIKCLHSAADIALKVKKPPKNSARKKWFDPQVNSSRRNLNRLANRLGSKHCNSILRQEYFKQRNKHSNFVNSKKVAFLKKLNEAIEEGHILDWKKFKRLKQEHDTSPLLDKFDLASFHDFFASLYKKPDQEPDLTHHNHKHYPEPPDLDILNKLMSESELTSAIKNLKKGKSCSNDLISNEMLQSLTPLCIKAILKNFNHSLVSGYYPWHTSIITPIYKSGNPFSPDNYRAIAVGSCMGKLFSSILLERLLHFKKLYCPDPKEQLGFSKGAQTNDHVFTLKTVIDKYTKVKKARLYACFVDLRKAFDTVCRDLLLHKITCLGISGNFFNCLTDMYRNSIAHIKISKLLSPNIDIGKGTEQGHPLSPDLFKIYINDLSSLLKSVGDYPILADVLISHLLWADDLVLLALSPKALQDNINILFGFCNSMGLEVNIKKTKIVIFCPPKRKQSYETFTLGGQPIQHTEKYCYLGIIFHRNGSFTAANTELRAKALRALYGLKGNIVKDALSHRSLNILFDSLIKPILLYGCQVLCPHSKTMRYLSKIDGKASPQHTLKYIAQDHYERFHLKFIKWSLSVHSKASNIGCWGESGRHPLFFEACKLAIDFYSRLESTENELLSAAFHEQIMLGLPWYTNISNILTKYNFPHSSSSKSKLSTQISHNMREEFVDTWKSAKASSPKLEFYNQIKHEFEPETYLGVVKFPDARKSLTRFRISCHNLYIERGRYETPLVPREHRWCTFCFFSKGLKPIEDEIHVLTDCLLYSSVREKFNFHPKNITDLTGLLSDKTLDPNKFTATARAIHSILSVNEQFTAYYKSPDFHSNTGNCIML